MKNIRLMVASELLKIAKEIQAIQFDTKQQLQEYKRNHKVRKDTKLTVKDKGQKQEKDGGKETTSVEMTPLQVKLDKTANHILSRVRKKVARNSHTHPSTLDKLANDKDVEVRILVARNKNTSTETLDKLANEKNYQIRSEVAKNLNTSTETLDKLADNTTDYWIRTKIVKHPNVSTKTLDKLANDKDVVLKMDIARNPNTSTETLDKLADVNDYNVKSDVARHPNTSTETLDKLANYKNPSIKYLITVNPNTSIDTMKKIVNDKTTRQSVRESAKKALEEKQLEKKKEALFNNRGFDMTKLSPELREKIKNWDVQDIKKFLAWLKKNKG